ncbi:Coiled-coil domain-containing protein 61 [Blattella germanica]|nr:Coiled-coil domain-containing protein 61 [Blattella germanica]
MNIINGNSLYLCVTDKYTSEDWQCTYDASYIENLTHKTGNFKQFDIFTTMLKSGLLKTSECITLDLLTYEDLEQLRSRQIMGRTFTTPRSFQSNHINPNVNRRFLILTYTVEFDR